MPQLVVASREELDTKRLNTISHQNKKSSSQPQIAILIEKPLEQLLKKSDNWQSYI